MRHTPARTRHARAMLALTYVSVFVVALWIPFVVAETSKRCEVPVGLDASLLRFVREVDVGLAALLLFNAINVLICLWEIALWRHRDLVIKRNRGYVKKFGDRVLPPLCLLDDITVSQAFSLEYWSIIFSQYASLDPSYVQHTSWSFWIDVGNGFTMPIPTLLLSIAVSGYPDLPSIASIPPRVVGIIAIVANYQMLYGTVMYFVNYSYNRYHVGASIASRVVVVVSNIIWIFGPIGWMIKGYRFVVNGSLVVV